jgi:tetratricopeptide (TPR) repeat protein
MDMKRYLLLSLFILISAAIPAQNAAADSIRNVLRNAKHDTARAGAMISLGEQIYMSQPDSAMALWQAAQKLSESNLKTAPEGPVKTAFLKHSALALNNIGFIYYRTDIQKAMDFFLRSLELEEQAGDDVGYAASLNNVATIYYQQGDVARALHYFEKSLEIKKKIGDITAIAISLNNIGNIYSDLGDIEKGLDYFQEGLRLQEKSGDKDGIAISYHSIASIYSAQNENAKALEYYDKSLKIREAMKDNYGIASSLGNMGTVYQEMGNFDKARECHLKSLELRKKLGDKKGWAATLVNLGNIYDRTGDRKKAMEYYQEALGMFETLKDKKSISHTLNNIAGIYYEEGDIAKALSYGSRGYELARELGYPFNLAHSSKLLYQVYKKQNNGLKALEMHEMYMQMKDSMEHESNKKSAIKKQLQYEYEKKTAADSVVNMEKTKLEEVKHQQEISKQRMYTYSGIIGFVLMLLIAVISFNAFRQKKNANTLIVHQKTVLEEKQKEILDSITYAQRIQNAILAKEGDIKNYFPDSFLFYKPKDIVAGDFYFFETTATHLFYAAADCTGHGVPGALVSVVCSNALSRCVKEFNLSDPGKILDKARELVLETFNKSGQDVKDGMDISLLVKDKSSGKYSWAGANNTLWIIRKHALTEIRSDKQPIGLSENPKPFSTHSLDVTKGDTIILYTDGYADQFGGSKGKKFKYKQLQEMLVTHSDLSMQEQKNILEKSFEEWKGPLEQVDDVCIIGVRI